MPSQRSSVASDTNNSERLEPKLLRAAENDDVASLKVIITSAIGNGQMSDNFLRIGLMRSSEKGKIHATQYLLEQGARTDVPAGNRLSPLMRAVEKNHIKVVQLLLNHGASPETADKKGRTALMTAAWKNHWHILQLLISRGADVNRKDLRKRNVLHNLAADRQCDWGDDVIDLLLKTDISIDGDQAKDVLGRTPLHWACATGKKRLAEQLLLRPRAPRANINATEIRTKTCLHIAAAHDRDDLVEMLLKYGADVHAKSDGGWTPLHNASDKGSEKIVRMLLQAGAEINGKLLNGATPLHLAAQAGHTGVVKCLLQCKEIKRTTRDTFGSTPFLRAAQSKQRDIVELLAPYNHVEALSEDALGACNGFDATIVDFGNYHNENRVLKRTVYELLYGRDPENPRKPAITAVPRNVKATNFRWIHLPANNMAWVEALLTKSFIEDGPNDVEGFKALERSFNHQHRGQKTHSQFMRPLCQSTPRAGKNADDELKDGATEQGPPTVLVDGASKQHRPSETPSKSIKISENKADWLKGSSDDGVKKHGKGVYEKKGKKANTNGGKGGIETPTKPHHSQSSLSPESKPLRSPGSPARKDPTQVAKGNICLFMPYLHFETDARRQEMQAAITRAETLPLTPALTKARTYDEMLIRAHLTSSSTALHVRRTLDQFFYHNIDTQSRDQDQVVYRYQTRCRDRDAASIDPKIFMVDQLWMWILGKDLIVTSFPQRWQQPKNDPLNVLEGIIEDINSKTREPVRSVYDLAMIITGRCSGVFDRHRMGDEEYQFLDMFESSIGSATDRETILFKDFNSASVQASEWLQHHRKPTRFSRHLESTSRNLEHTAHKEDRFKFEDHSQSPLFVDRLLDIGQETDLLAETKDIRDELNMIRMVLEQQRQVLPDLEAAICDVYKEEHKSQQEVKKRFRDQQKTIEMHVKDIERMDKQAERIYNSITDLLDLKQKHANAFEARFARDQAAGTARQGQTIMVFTIVTIVFLPLSFIAAFFTINITDFPRDAEGNEALSLGYVSKYMFGIGFAISIPLVLVALRLEDIADFFRDMVRRFQNRKANGQEPTRNEEARRTIEVVRVEHTLSTTRSPRASVESQWMRNINLHAVASLGTDRSEAEMAEVGYGRLKTGFRIRNSRDLERGLE